MKNNLMERKKLVIEYIKINPHATYSEIKKNLHIKINTVYPNGIIEAYREANVEYPRKESYSKTPVEKRNIIINLIKKNPNLTLHEITKITGIKNFYRLFKDINQIYEKAGIKMICGGEKIRIRKKNKIIKYIKKNQLSTQREINKVFKTHIQEIFKGGIIEAYKKAGIPYPFERRKVHGTAIKSIKERAKKFEEEIAIKLSGYGNVNRLVRTKRGIADIILERQDKNIIIEIKDYQLKDISISQIKQLSKYLEDYNSNIGLLICHKKPLKDKFIIGKNRIFVLEKHELNKIPEIVQGL